MRMDYTGASYMRGRLNQTIGHSQTTSKRSNQSLKTRWYVYLICRRKKVTNSSLHQYRCHLTRVSGLKNSASLPFVSEQHSMVGNVSGGRKHRRKCCGSLARWLTSTGQGAPPVSRSSHKSQTGLKRILLTPPCGWYAIIFGLTAARRCAKSG